MHILDAQREMRSAFLGGFVGQTVSGTIWLIAAAVGTLGAATTAMAVLFFGSAAIFPLTQLGVRMLGRPGRVSEQNALWPLGAQTAFTVPIGFLLVGAATLHRETWFFPAAMIVVGAHYLPFVTLYGMRSFAVLGAALVLAGAGLALYGPPVFALGGWVTGPLLIAAGAFGRAAVLREERTAGGPDGERDAHRVDVATPSHRRR
jgi:hypothetical protein